MGNALLTRPAGYLLRQMGSEMAPPAESHQVFDVMTTPILHWHYVVNLVNREALTASALPGLATEHQGPVSFHLSCALLTSRGHVRLLLRVRAFNSFCRSSTRL